MSSCDPTYRTDRQKISSLHILLSHTNSRRQISCSPTNSSLGSITNNNKYEPLSDVKMSSKRNRSMAQYSHPKTRTALLLLKEYVESYCLYEAQFLEMRTLFKPTIAAYWLDVCMQVGINGEIAFTDDILSQVRANSLLNSSYLRWMKGEKIS